MDYVIRITDNTSGTVTLTTSPFDVRDYHPMTADRTEETVSETITVRLRDTTSPDNLDEIRALNRLLHQAELAQENRAFDRVYLEFSPDGTVSYWRSEIVRARGEFADTTFKYAYWLNNTQFADVFLERMNFWEGPEAQLSLTNPNGTANTTGLKVYNTNDGTGSGGSARYNYVQVAGTAVLGDLPAATRLEMIYDDRAGGTATLDYIWIGKKQSDLTNFDPILEAEDSNKTGVADATQSGGQYASGTAVTNVIANLMIWTFGTALIDAYAGRYYKAFIKFRGAEGAEASDSYFEFRWVDDDVSTIWTSSRYKPAIGDTYNFVDMQTIPVPPWLQGLGNQGTAYMTVAAAPSTYGTAVYDLDYVILLPTDGYRAIDLNANDVGNRVIDDGIDDRTYTDNASGANRVGVLATLGSPIMLEPSTNQNLYFIAKTNTSFSINAGLIVKLYYRPRRLTI